MREREQIWHVLGFKVVVMVERWICEPKKLSLKAEEMILLYWI
jgi:hypothetical protein